MLKEYLQIRTLSLVVLGKFNPAIIQPFWLASKKLIKEQEAKEAKVDIVHPQLTRYDLDWVNFEISENRFIFKSSKEPFFNSIKDLVEGIFSFLPETPINAIGINHLLHFSIPSSKQYYELGNRLTPLNNWTNILDDPKMLDFSITEQKRKDGQSGQYTVKIQPSNLVPQYGVLVSVNDHLSSDIGDRNANELITRMKNGWQDSFKRADGIPDLLWKKLNII